MRSARVLLAGLMGIVLGAGCFPDPPERDEDTAGAVDVADSGGADVGADTAVEDTAVADTSEVDTADTQVAPDTEVGDTADAEDTAAECPGGCAHLDG
ncbi:MAG: hypothetical protein KC621_00430, partial [Myxococcales bacterium]|nr:hypothetical protein [Myxococcales bacterium]